MLIVSTTALCTAVAMEAWSAWIHSRAWHGRLWWSHKSHHRSPGDIAALPHAKRHRFELNDIFGVLHAAVAAPVMAAGITYRSERWGQFLLGVSIGMTLFGLAYMLVHDGLAHGRLPVRWLKKSRFLWRVAAAHRVHHRTGGAPFGLFTGPMVLRRAAQRRRESR